MRAEILEYLAANSSTGEFVKINDLLKSLTTDLNHLQVIAWWLGYMERTDAIQLAGQWSDIGEHGKNLDNTDIEARIRPLGVLEHNQNLEKKRQFELLEAQTNSTVSTNQALKDGSQSAIELNTETKKYYKKQMKAAYAVAFFTAVSMTTGICTYINSPKNADKPLKKELQDLQGRTSQLDSTLKAQIKIDSFLRSTVEKISPKLPLDSSKTRY